MGLTTATPKSFQIDYKSGEFLDNVTFWYDTRINMIYLSTNRLKNITVGTKNSNMKRVEWRFNGDDNQLLGFWGTSISTSIYTLGEITIDVCRPYNISS